MLDKAYLGLAKDWSLWQEELQNALEQITEAISDALQVQRVSIWQFNDNAEFLEPLDLYSHENETHSIGNRLERKDYPDYFLALGQGRVIDAIDACLDFRTREFCDSYLRPLGIGAMLNATLRVAGETRGVNMCRTCRRSPALECRRDTFYRLRSRSCLTNTRN